MVIGMDERLMFVKWNVVYIGKEKFVSFEHVEDLTHLGSLSCIRINTFECNEEDALKCSR